MKKFTQFIAGAICPSCSEQDSIAIHKDDDEIFCAKCGYKEFRPGSKKDPKKDPKKEAIIKAINVVDIKDFNKIKK